MERFFLETDGSPLVAIAERLISQAPPSSNLDLSDIIVLLPSQMAVRELIVELVRALSDAGRTLLTPPVCLTPGGFVKFVLDSDDVFMSQAVRVLVIQEVLRDRKDLVKRLMDKASLPESGHEWLSLSGQLDNLRKLLYGELCSFDDVIACLEGRGLDVEIDRWRVIQELEDCYLTKVTEKGLLDPFRERNERLQSISFECKKIYVAGCIELSMLAKRLIENIRSDTEFIVLDSNRFSNAYDGFGCVVINADKTFDYKIASESVLLVDRYWDQAKAVLHVIEGVASVAGANDILISSCDEDTWESLQQVLKSHGVKARPASGASLIETSICQLLSLIKNFCATNGFAQFADLLRHPDFESLLKTRLDRTDNVLSTDISTVLDIYYSEHLPESLSQLVRIASKNDKDFQTIFYDVKSVLTQFISSSEEIKVWNYNLIELLTQVYPDDLADQDADLRESCISLASIFEDLFAADSSLFGKISGQDYLELIIFLAKEKRLPAEVEPGAINLIGWLELQLQFRKVVIVTDFTEGNLPQAIDADQFLPNSIRTELNLPSNERRFARDACLLSRLSRSGSQLFFTVNRRTANNDYALPSRFLSNFNIESEDDVFSKILLDQPIRFVSEEDTSDNSDLGFTLEAPKKISTIESVSITSLRTYLECPFLFYLRHVLCLREFGDSSTELSALQFGNVIHSVLHELYLEGCINISQEDNLFALLEKQLEEYFIANYASGVVPAVKIQFEQIRSRLKHFVGVHCRRLSEGWQVIHHEYPSTKDDKENFKNVYLQTDTGEIELTGRIDRIEKNSRTGQVAVFDYKTGDSVPYPDQSHRKKLPKGDSRPYEWLDLQLPAYWLVLVRNGWRDDLSVGYCDIGSDLAGIDFYTADWDLADFRDAEEKIQEVVQAIVDQKFWPPKVVPHKDSSLYRLYAEYAA